MPSPNSLSQSSPRKRRKGCLGCLGQSVLVLVLGAVFLTALTGLFYPWAFYLGGKFHIVPMWQGWGRLHGKAGDYLVWVQFEPTPRGSKMYLESNLTGNAYLCTPRGERFPMHLGGGMPKHLNLSTDGEPIHLYMNYWPLWYGGFINDRRPSLEFRGKWQNPKIVMDDHGSIANAFEPDGTVYRGHSPNHPYSTEGIPITFMEGPRSEFDDACTAMKH
jgi:hypothetical protein